jgi:hypothetical protein
LRFRVIELVETVDAALAAESPSEPVRVPGLAYAPVFKQMEGSLWALFSCDVLGTSADRCRGLPDSPFPDLCLDRSSLS